jgi:hypothetical protein
LTTVTLEEFAIEPSVISIRAFAQRDPEATEKVMLTGPGAGANVSLAGMPGGIPSLRPTLTKQMLERPSAADFQRQVQHSSRQVPRAAHTFHADPLSNPFGLLNMPGTFRQESDADHFNRSLNAFMSLARAAAGQEKMALEKYLGLGTSATALPRPASTRGSWRSPTGPNRRPSARATRSATATRRR